MPAKVNDVHRMLVNKLDAKWTEGGGHTKYKIIEGDTLVANTVLSRSISEMDESLLNKISRQLSVRRQQFGLLLQCTWSRQDYINSVLGQSPTP